MRTPLALLTTFVLVSSAHSADLVVEDIFGRRLNEHGLTLVDWEGEIANPAIRFYITPPVDAAFPAEVVLTSDEPRVYFNLPGEIGPNGPRKVVKFTTRERMPVLASIFGDRDGEDRDLALQLEFEDAACRKQSLSLPCHVIDHDRKNQKPFPILVDFSQDRTGFFKDETKRQVVAQAAQDWADFFEPIPFDESPAGAERTLIWSPEGFKNARTVVNAQPFTGYLLYAYGIESSEIRSGGEPSRMGALQSQNGKRLFIHRSGGVEIETRGNYNTKGWMVSLAPADFWKATNLSPVSNDLYSIAHHEIGHSLIFNPANPLFEKAKANGKFTDASIKEYFGADLTIDRSDHLRGAVDPASRRGAYGNEYYGDMPYCRWQITKLDLLVAKAVGWQLRATSAFAPLQLQTQALPAGAVGKEYASNLTASGGVPFYFWQVTAGALPAGLKLDSFTGAITGVPTKPGVFDLTIRVRDYDEKSSGLTRSLRLEIEAQSAKARPPDSMSYCPIFDSTASRHRPQLSRETR